MPGPIVPPMTRPAESQPAPAPPPASLRTSIARLLPLGLLVLASVTIVSMGWHRALSLENLVKHRATIDAFIMMHGWMAVAAFALLYVAVVALSIPGGATLL